MDLFSIEIQKVLIAALLGALMGLERQWRSKPAGLRTLILVTAGSALFTIVSYHFATLRSEGDVDITRIASNIVTGIGFIGAGIIFRGKNHVHGLTTAATVWIAAAVGIAVGLGEYYLAVAVTVLVWLVLTILQKVDELLARLIGTFTYKVCFAEGVSIKEISIENYFDKDGNKLRELRYEKQDGRIVMYWSVKATKKIHAKAAEMLMSDSKVTAFSYS